MPEIRGEALEALIDDVQNEMGSVVFGEVGPDDVIDYNIPFKGDPELIEYIEKGCGCTSAFFRDGAIQGQIHVNQANGNQNYQPGLTTINKYVTVYVNDGQPRFMSDNLKQRKTNPQKSWFRIKLTFSVVVD